MDRFELSDFDKDAAVVCVLHDSGEYVGKWTLRKYEKWSKPSKKKAVHFTEAVHADSVGPCATFAAEAVVEAFVLAFEVLQRD
jgi:hypothetical protein